ncbi:lactosylceramide 1,3-N-acetyl-beta-D-glucosaminyltransferase B-like [Littorina saxatilis]|uniref:Hexosyltransferase n=1 Tax=Littorina saxatilis TaxID=31220 RepID=A0AAN9BAZ9_9CAEN
MGMPPAVSLDGDPGTYTINQPSVCSPHSEILLLVVIKTIFAHFDRRTVIRDTWASRKNYHGSFVHVLFFFDMSENNKHIQESIERESKMNKDIVQYTADYSQQSNLTVKTSIAAQWVSEFCPQTKFVLVADDNVVVDIYKILPFLRELPQTSDSNAIALCHYRTSASEMLLSKHQTMPDDDHNFCSNEAFVASPSVLDQLYLTLKLKGLNLREEHLWLSAVAEAAGVKYANTSQHFAGARKKPSVLKTFMAMDYVSSSVMIGIVKEDFQGKEATIMKHIWRIIQEHHTKMQISNVYRAQFPQPKGQDIGGVRFMAVVLMCVDFGVVVVILAVIFCKKRRKKWW